jgi:hypothetical protein
MATQPIGSNTYERLLNAFGSGALSQKQLQGLADEIDYAAGTAPGTGANGSITGSFDSDGAFSTVLPSGALITGATIVPSTLTGVSISMGTLPGGSDVLPPTVVSGLAAGPTGLQGSNFLLQIFPSAQAIFVHSTAWAPITITIWFAGPPIIPTNIGLFNDGGLLVTTDLTWPIDSAGSPGTVWSNGGGVGAAGVCSLVPGGTPLPGPPVFFGQITSTQLLSLGGRTLLAATPTTGSLQLYVADDQILVA